MSGRFTVTPQQLLDVIERMNRFDQHIESAVANIERKIDQLHSTWIGDAAQAHQATHQKWTHAVQQMRHGLATMRQNVTTAHSNYTNAVNANVSMWEQAQ